MKRPEIGNLIAAVNLKKLTIRQQGAAIIELQELGKYTDQLEAERKPLTHEELMVTAKKVIKLADNMINTFETMEEDQCWEIAIMAALSDNQFKKKELLLPSVNVALPKCTNCGNLMKLAAFECSCGLVKEA